MHDVSRLRSMARSTALKCAKANQAVSSLQRTVFSDGGLKRGITKQSTQNVAGRIRYLS